MEVPAPAGILRTAACNSATLSENGADCVTFSSKEKTERRSPGRNTRRMKSFGFELIDFLRDAFFEELKGFEGKIGRGAIVLVEDADEDVDEIDGDANAATLRGGIL